MCLYALSYEFSVFTQTTCLNLMIRLLLRAWVQCTEVLLKHGADPNTTTSDGTSVLSVAIFDGDVEVHEMRWPRLGQGSGLMVR